ncbi:hypothetical protein L211DRAFT_832190 [Terfezia boudieri ATCC MYA-4762]|uniref:Uncharacterized protein n=1 Tax=Terfezia boudieri ATCC MYA-4762 TaxID=1051890 RepID=A0A3N4M398_9PEZI|nr:hypothetical protein L211DRAFT_832190 [Terfezia boudieri ATCC MYA-4762]
MSRPAQDEPEQGQGQDVSEPPGNAVRTRIQVPPVTQLPPEVAEEIAAYLRSQLFAPISAGIGQLKSGCEIMLAAQKDVLQEVRVRVFLLACCLCYSVHDTPNVCAMAGMPNLPGEDG